MDADRFDAIAKDLTRSTSRRRTVGALLGGALAGLGVAGPGETWAKSGRCQPKCGECKKCKKGNCEKKDGKQRCKHGKCQAKPNDTPCTGGSCQGGTCVATPFCAGKNACSDASPFTTCQNGGTVLCACFVRVDTGASICGRADAGLTTDCSATPCPPGETCVDLRGGQCDDPGNPGGLKCAQACPNPL